MAAAPAGSGSGEKVGFADDARIFLKIRHRSHPCLRTPEDLYTLKNQGPPQARLLRGVYDQLGTLKPRTHSCK